jgi:hypothetical protein
MRYEAATGWLVGEPHRGLAAMFLMMNAARLHVGLQGLGRQEMATQNALRYALSACRAARCRGFGGAADAIAAAPGRAPRCSCRPAGDAPRRSAWWPTAAALALDEAAHHEDAAVRQAAPGGWPRC